MHLAKVDTTMMVTVCRFSIYALANNRWLCEQEPVSSEKKSSMFFSFREKMAQAYDFALEKIGMDAYSYTIWNDYITFLKSV